MCACVLGCCQPFGIQVLCRSCFKLRLLTPFFYDCFMYCAIKTKIMANRKYKHTHTHILPYIHTHIYLLIHTLRQKHTQFALRLGDCFTPPTATLAIWLCTLCVTVRMRDYVSVRVSVCVCCECLTVCVFIVRFFICILLGCVKAFKHIISIAENNTKGLTLISTYDLCVPVSVPVSVCWCVCVCIPIAAST